MGVLQPHDYGSPDALEKNALAAQLMGGHLVRLPKTEAFGRGLPAETRGIETRVGRRLGQFVIISVNGARLV